MERANSIKEFICRVHSGEPIRKISYGFGSISLYCVECLINLDKIVPRNLHAVENLLNQAVKVQIHDKELAAKTRHLPDGVAEVLHKEQEIKMQLADHIEKEKARTNQTFDNLKQQFIDQLEKKRIEALKLLDDQLVTLDINFKLFSDRIKECQEGSTKDMTFESLVSQINQLEDSRELEKFLALLKSEIDEKQSFIGLKSEEIVQSMHAGVTEMSRALSETTNKMPTSLFGDPIKFEEIQSKYTSAVNKCLAEIQLSLVNPIAKLSLTSIGIDSLIIKEQKYVNLIKHWLSESGVASGKFELIYRASKHGWGGYNFHQKCDKKGPTVVVIQATTGERFGGYSPFDWISDGTGPYFPTTKSFLFSLDSEEKLGVKEQQHAVYSHSAWGPCWGNVSDLAITDQCHVSGSYSDTGNTYYQLKGRKYFTNERSLVVKEFEVFALQ